MSSPSSSGGDGGDSGSESDSEIVTALLEDIGLGLGYISWAQSTSSPNVEFIATNDTHCCPDCIHNSKKVIDQERNKGNHRSAESEH